MVGGGNWAVRRQDIAHRGTYRRITAAVVSCASERMANERAKPPVFRCSMAVALSFIA